MQQIKITDIRWDYYPRAESNQKQIDLYRSAIENLPPIAVNKNMIGIDGYHRCQAYRQEGHDEIPATIEDIPDDQVLIEAIKRNAAHGLQLNGRDKRRLGVMLYPQLTIEEIADLLSVSEESVYGWTAKKRAEEKTEEDRTIWDMWLACYSQEEIAKELKLKQDKVSRRITDLCKSTQISNPQPLKTFNLWNFPKCDDRFGIKYPGRIPGQIVEHLLYYFTDPFDIVWDLFGGGGTTIDVCNHMARRYQVFDIDPIRDDIIRHDLMDSLPSAKAHMAPRLIFLDPPYWKQKKGEYSSHETNLANMSLEAFYKAIVSIVKQSLKKADVVALLIGTTRKEGNRYDHASMIMSEIGPPFQRIIVPYPTEIVSGADVTSAKEGKYMLSLYRDLIIWRKADD